MNLFGSALESAVRSLLVAGVVWAGLRVFRVRSVLALKTVWGLVLAAAVAMPLLLPVAARWKALPVGATLVLPAPMQKLLGVEPQFAQAPKAARAVETYSQQVFAEAQAEATRPHERATPVEKFAAAGRAAREDSYFSSEVQASKYDTPAVSRTELAAPAERWRNAAGQTPSRKISAIGMAWLLYLSVAAALLLRMALGVAAAYRIWHRAEPVEADAFFGIDGLQVRASGAVASPVTIGSGIVLPAEFAEWDGEKLRIVLAHERSHIRQKDFYLQLLAGLHAIVFWFSPLGWWLKRRLSDLAEAISDRAGLREAKSRSAYAQVLLEF
ncbi:MAG TPA: M56 family metallopeptidase, partial [Terracidiphilus sp.]|nr:M56 family metallopeptidase [Terracidiphilus sp.]